MSAVEDFLKENSFYCMAVNGRISKLQCKYSRVRGQHGRKNKNLAHSLMCDTKCKHYSSPKKAQVEKYIRMTSFRGTRVKYKEVFVERAFDEQANISRGSSLKRILSEESD